MTDSLSGIRVVEPAAWVFVPAEGSVLVDWGLSSSQGGGP